MDRNGKLYRYILAAIVVAALVVTMSKLPTPTRQDVRTVLTSLKQATGEQSKHQSEGPQSVENQIYTPNTIAKWTSRVCKKKTSPKWHSQLKEDQLLYNWFYRKGICNGTFVEIGALDGVQLSNTYAYQYQLDWNGLLIEAQPTNAARLKVNRPEAHTVHSATCFPNQTSVKFAGKLAVGGIPEKMSKRHRKGWGIEKENIIEVPCAPLYTLMAKASIQAIDFFTLDVEGAEFEVLRTMNWHVPVGIWVVELNGQDAPKDAKVRRTLSEHGYKEESVQGMHQINSVFVHPKYKEYLAALS